MCTLLYLPPFFLPLFLSSNIRKQKSVVDKEKKEKKKKIEVFCFWAFFFEVQNEASPNDPRAYVLAEVGAVIR